MHDLLQFLPTVYVLDIVMVEASLTTAIESRLTQGAITHCCLVDLRNGHWLRLTLFLL